MEPRSATCFESSCIRASGGLKNLGAKRAMSMRRRQSLNSAPSPETALFCVAFACAVLHSLTSELEVPQQWYSGRCRWWSSSSEWAVARLPYVSSVCLSVLGARDLPDSGLPALRALDYPNIHATYLHAAIQILALLCHPTSIQANSCGSRRSIARASVSEATLCSVTRSTEQPRGAGI